jgi:hypothetical protein
MDPEVSSPNSQDLSTYKYPEPDPSRSHHPILSLQDPPILSTHLRLGLPSGLFPSGFSTNDLYVVVFSSIRATCPTHLILIDFIILIVLGEEYKSRSSSLCSFLYPPVISNLNGPDILLSTLFSNTLILCSSLKVRDQASHPYRTTGKIIILYIPVYTFLDSR